MYLNYYGLKEQPFGVTPDPKFLYHSRSHREALASLYYGIKADRGFMTLIAPPGFGKTTLLFHLLENLNSTARTAFLFQTQCNSGEFLRYLAADLGCDRDERDPVVLHAKLNEILTSSACEGKRVVAVIDEAQNLEDSVLETVRLLSDFETPARKLIQIVLSGQPQLAHRLEQPSLQQLQQRITMRSRIEPLGASEIFPYIEHRLKIAGYQGPGLFRRESLALIAAHSQGIPRLINSICFQCLSLGYARRARKIGAAITQEALQDLNLKESPLAGRNGPPGPDRSRGQEDRAQAALPEDWTPNPLRCTDDLTSTRSGMLSRLRFPIVVAASLSFILIAGEITRSLKRAPAPVPERPEVTVVPEHEHFVTVAVGPNETLSSICLRCLDKSLGPGLLDQIMKLNPQITNPNFIRVGEVIRLPVQTEGASEEKAEGRQDFPPAGGGYGSRP